MRGMENDDGRGVLWAAGRAAAKALFEAGAWVGRAAKAGVDSVDPDVWKHAADLPLVALTMLSPRARGLNELPDDGHPPVLFVHGLGGHPGNFLPMRLFFRAQGRTSTHAVTLPSDCSVQVLGEVLADTLTEAAHRTPRREVDVVAHSLGGLVARAALLELARRPNADCRVRTLVTLGTPHTGSHLARYANTVTTRDLRPDSALLRRLDEQLPWKGPPAQPRLVALWSRADVIILPAENATAAGATNVELAGLSHNGLLLSPRAWEAVFDAVKDGEGAHAAQRTPPR
jgi:triacylglycerol esterase/lipase EstA (alpha/beta hydrolase family)